MNIVALHDAKSSPDLPHLASVIPQYIFFSSPLLPLLSLPSTSCQLITLLIDSLVPLVMDQSVFALSIDQCPCPVEGNPELGAWSRAAVLAVMEGGNQRWSHISSLGHERHDVGECFTRKCRWTLQRLAGKYGVRGGISHMASQPALRRSDPSGQRDPISYKWMWFCEFAASALPLT